ncbi:MAG: hypothetical protein JNL38_29105 [Myxococcales bacterium]|jgi:hypothetical protein|nr:hypothetical protein [Myxococcales bacterium]
MQMKQVLAVAAIAAVAGVLVAGKSDAGTKTPEPVVIDAAHKAFWGNMGTARASADNLQHIGCQITASSSGIVANCLARDVNNVSVACTSNEPNIVQAVGALSSGSTLHVVHDGAGKCMSVSVRNFSYYSIKVP